MSTWLVHSKGPWKEHKYIRKEGEGENARYIYSTSVSVSTPKQDFEKTDEDEAYEAALERSRQAAYGYLEEYAEMLDAADDPNNHMVDKYDAERSKDNLYSLIHPDGKEQVDDAVELYIDAYRNLKKVGENPDNAVDRDTKQRAERSISQAKNTIETWTTAYDTLTEERITGAQYQFSRQSKSMKLQYKVKRAINRGKRFVQELFA